MQTDDNDTLTYTDEEARQYFRDQRAQRLFAARRLFRKEGWRSALLRVSSEERPRILRYIWRWLLASDKPEAMAEAITSGDAPYQELEFLRTALVELLKVGTLAFDSLEARADFAKLPNVLTIYRGTVEEEYENDDLGVCWTLDRKKAIWFATEHGRFRNLDSPPFLLAGKVRREHISGYLIGREEREILVNPHFAYDIGGEPIDG